MRWATAVGLAVVLLLSGCASMGESEHLTHDQLMNQAANRAADGDSTDAISLFEKAAKADPVDPTPWVGIAKLHFDNSDYVKALTASEEAISRDGQNNQANSIALVSSLRLAEASLATLQNQSDLKGSMRQRANQLADQLRETLGESILPAGESEDSGKSQTTRKRRRSSTRHSSSHSRRSSSSASRSASQSSSSKSTSAAPDDAGQDTQGGDSDDGSLNPFQKLESLPK
ncbi:hypothetical protein D3260_14740 [Salinisphaera sp. Q1T1-3]|nr:hypothetical protein D3260_14740 [Salinisphaera sp. Q1T1-3]